MLVYTLKRDSLVSKRSCIMRKRVEGLAALLAASLLLGGCGDAPYELTEQEQNVVVNYAAHIVAKYNTYQSEGLKHVWPEDLAEETEETEAPEEQPAESTETEATEEAPPEAEPPVPDAAESTLTDLFGENGVEMAFTGARLQDSYMGGSYYALDPDEGMRYLVVGVDVTNSGPAAVSLDNIAKSPTFYVTVNHLENAPSELTLLSEDFASFEGSIPAGETRETVILFQVPESVASIDSLDVYVTLGGANYKIPF